MYKWNLKKLKNNNNKAIGKEIRFVITRLGGEGGWDVKVEEFDKGGTKVTNFHL